MHNIFSPTLAFAVKCSKEAGRKILQMRASLIHAKQKTNRHNIVTSADFVSEKLLIDSIKTKYQSHGIISEETGIVNSNSDNFWIIDPLDGTSNFAAGLDWFGVMMAYVCNGKVLCGVAYLPALNYLYYAEIGKNFYKGSECISINENLTIEDSLCTFGIDANGTDQLVRKQFRIIHKVAKVSRNIRSTNCLLDFCLVAEGKIGGVINFNMKIWDIAALNLIITMAGGVVSDLKGRPIDFSFSENILEKEFAVVAGAPKVHRALLEIIEESGCPTTNQS